MKSYKSLDPYSWLEDKDSFTSKESVLKKEFNEKFADFLTLLSKLNSGKKVDSHPATSKSTYWKLN